MDKNNGGPDTEAAPGERTSCLLSLKPLIMCLQGRQGDLLGVAELRAQSQRTSVQLCRLRRKTLAPGKQQTLSRQHTGTVNSSRSKEGCWNSGEQQEGAWQGLDGQSTCWPGMRRFAVAPSGIQYKPALPSPPAWHSPFPAPPNTAMPRAGWEAQQILERNV